MEIIIGIIGILLTALFGYVAFASTLESFFNGHHILKMRLQKAIVYLLKLLGLTRYSLIKGYCNKIDNKYKSEIIKHKEGIIQTGIYKFKEHQRIQHKQGDYKLIKTDIGYRLDAGGLSITNVKSTIKIVDIIKRRYNNCWIVFEPQIK